MPEHQLLRLPQVLAKTGLSRSSLYAFIKDGRFPASVQISERTVGWHTAEIDDWINQRPRSFTVRQEG